jgi:tight adherence protein C
MSRIVALCALTSWVGATLLLAELRWFRHRPLLERLRPYRPGGLSASERSRSLSVQSLRDVVGPLATDLGTRLARLLGIGEELAVRLERIGSTEDVTAFRVRQAVWASGAFAGVAGLSIVLGVPGPVVIAAAIGAPLLAFCIIEQQLASASVAWQRHLVLELPVILEQLGILLSSGYSLGAAIARIGQRGHGVCAKEFRTVTLRVRQGVAQTDALRELAARADIAALHRLVGVLALNREAGDLGALISAEARNVRQDVHRQLIETIERRGEQVWIPVTVATLLPGVIFMAVPFIDAMGKLSGS